MKQEWLEEMASTFPTFPADQAWKALQGHLASVFRTHGIQAITLLDPSTYTPPEQVENLSSLLNNTLRDTVPPEQHVMARGAISSFFDAIAEHPERTKYIAQLGDGVFMYFSLSVEPQVAQHLHKKLNPLTLFFDTNFLFVFFNLQGTKKHNEVSNELLRIIEKYRFPFKLRYHQATEREMRSTIAHYGSVLRSGQTSSIPSSIELEYHQRNAETGIDVDTFLKPYEHIDYILNSNNILIHRMQAAQRRMQSPNLQEYRRFLEARGRFKDEDTLNHDIILLETVHQLRSKAKSSLEAGALIITWDKLLYKFDWETSRAKGRQACVVLPDQLLQVLRPFVPSDSDFDRSFAATFALPEFRAMDSNLPKAQQQLFSYLTAYEPFPEETAAGLLTNGLLIDRLHKVENDEQIQKDVESEIAHKNEMLLEENAALAKILEDVKVEKAAKEKQLEQERLESGRIKARVEEAEELLRRKDKELAALKKQPRRQETSDSKQQKAQIDQALELATKEQHAREEAEKHAAHEALLRQETERKVRIYAVSASFALSFILIFAFEALVYLTHWVWLLNSSNSYGLQITFDATVAVLITGVFHPHWRRWCWGSGVLFFIGLLIQLLGGPKGS